VQGKEIAGHATKTLTVAAVVAVLALSLTARAETPAPVCDTPLELIRFANPLSHFGQKLQSGAPITVVAIGSSSTAGAGASSPAKNYPNQLAVELRKRFPANSFVVINRGVNGEEIADMLKRFDDAVIAAKPDLVLWQLGTNSVIRDHMFTDHGAAIRGGLKRIRTIGAETILIDPQFVPRVIAKGEAEHMVELIATTAKLENVELYRRFEVMKHWHDVDHIAFESFVSPDGLHLNDWSYTCMAHGLALAIAEAAQRPVMSATAAAHLLP